MSRNSSSDNYFTFILFVKTTNEVIGFIGLGFNPNEEGTFNVYYYVKKEHRRRGYMKEAFNALLDIIRKDEIIFYGPWNRARVLEETKPIIKLLRIELDEDNIASFNTAKSLGFEYEGKIVSYKRINGEDKYIGEHHFIKKI